MPLLTVAGVRTLAVDSSRIYWSSTTTNRRLETCDLSACAGTRRAIPVPDCQIEDMGMDASAVYWVADGYCPNSGGAAADRSQLWKVAK